MTISTNKTENQKKLTALIIQEFLSNHPYCQPLGSNYVNTLKPVLPPQLKNVNLSNSSMSQISLHPVLLSILCGTIFGDSSLTIPKNYTNARLQCRHSTRQTEWFMWKSLCVFYVFTNSTNITMGIDFQQPDGYQAKTEKIGGEMLGKWHYQSAVNVQLTALCNIVCPSNKKEYKRSWLNHMNAYFLMTLWLDDGSLSKGRQGVISCNDRPAKEAQILVDYIFTVWGVKCSVTALPSKSTSTNPNPVEITIDDFANLEKFISIIAPIVPVRSMLYKVCLYLNDISFLQRWISYLKSIFPASWHNDIDKYYAYMGSIDLN